MTEPTFTYGLTTARERGKIVNHEGTWADIVELFRTPVRRKITMAQYAAMSPKDRAHSKNTGLFFGGNCNDGHRKDNSLVSRSMVNLDLDDHCAEIWADWELLGMVPQLEGLTYLVHSTRSSTDAAPKFRIWLPLSREVTPAEYEPVARAIAEMLDKTMMAVARESYTPAQGMYLPSVSSDQEYHFGTVEGALFNPDKALKKYPAGDADTWPKRAREQVTEYVPGRKMTHPEDKKTLAPMITAVHRAFDPHTFIAEFLSEVYEPAGDRYSIYGASGAPSVRIYDDAFIQSDHGSDPARGQHNTFDLGRIHLFGDLDKDHDLGALSPVDWPSYQAMYDFMLERPEVIEALAEVEAEAVAEKLAGYLDELPELDDDEDEDDDDDDLIGSADDSPKKKKKKAAGVQELVRRLRALLGRAEDLADVQAATKRIQEIPEDVLPDSIRSMLCSAVQEAYERQGEKITKATAAKAIAHRRLSLIERVADADQPDWLDGWVHVYGDAVFHHADTNRIVNNIGFDSLYTRYMRFTQVDMNPKTGLPLVSPSAAALNLWTIPSAYQVRFMPDLPEFYTEDGVDFVNSYRKPIIPDDGYRGNKGVKMLKRLLAELYPDERHQALICDFLAHAYRFPAKKMKYALLLKGVEEEGKTLLYRLLRRVLGKNNCAVVQTAQLKKEFNDYIDSKLLCCVEEVKLTGSDGIEALNNMKAMITNNDVSVEGKGTKVRNIENFCNWLVFTNFEDAVPIDDTDSRWLVIFSRFQNSDEAKELKARLLEEEGKDYREELYDEIERHPWQFIRFLEEYQFSAEYRANSRAPHTHFKTMMAEDGKSEEVNVLEDLLDRASNPLISATYVHTAALRDEFLARGIGSSFRGRGVAVLMKTAGFRKCKETTFREGGVQFRIDGWTRDKEKVDREGRLHGNAVQEIREILTKTEDLDDGEDLRNVVLLRKKR